MPHITTCVSVCVSANLLPLKSAEGLFLQGCYVPLKLLNFTVNSLCPRCVTAHWTRIMEWYG